MSELATSDVTSCASAHDAGDAEAPARSESASSDRPPSSAAQTVGRHSETGSRRFLRRFAAQRLALAGLIALIAIILLAVFAPWIAPADPNKQDLRSILQPAFTPGHLLGTDQLGRDVLSRLMFGARFSLIASAEAVGVGLGLGFIPGLVAGYFGRWVDWIVMRVVEALMSFPPIILAIAVVAALGPGLTKAMLAVGIVFMPRIARMTRDATLQVRSETFVEAARSMGLTRAQILRRHVVPHIMSPIIVMSSILAGVAMIVEAGLSFVGLGATPPASSWGTMLAGSSRFMSNAPLLIVWPGLCVAVSVLCLNLVGDGIKDSLGRESRSR